ncbi:MAG: DUF2752 domain-containing protein [Planctomycetota bacterium]|jgi:hypothetical protein
MKSARYLFAAPYIPRTARGRTQRSGKTAWFFQPVVASILQKQKTPRIMSAIASFHLVVTMSGGQAWQCPVHSTLGIPGPGCGLSTATVSLIRGDWRTALSIHAFAPLVVIAIISMLVLSLLPRRFYRIAVLRLAVLESNSGLTGLLLIGFIGYWGIRFFWFF